MMSGVPLETCRAFNKLWNNKFYYKAASCWYIYWIIYDARILEYQVQIVLSTNCYATEKDKSKCNIFGAWAFFRIAGPQYFYWLLPHLIVTVHHCFISICFHLLKCSLAVTVQHIIISSVLNKLMVSLSH